MYFNKILSDRALGNPLLNNSVLTHYKSHANSIKKLGFSSILLVLLMLLITTSFFLWSYYEQALVLNNQKEIAVLKNFALGCGILSFGLAFIASIKPQYSLILSLFYSISAGIFITGLSIVAEMRFPGIALLTVQITLVAFLVMYLLFSFQLIHSSKKFKLIIYVLTSTIALVYLLSFLLRLMDISIPFIHESSIGGIAWSGFVLVIAILNLVVDFDKIKNLNNSAPYYVKWYVALSLMVSLVWIYIATLRVLMKLKQFNK